MHSEVCLQRLSIEGFRGFRDRQEFDVAGSAVIIAGPNGTGKTSFFDAIQWVLLGRLERLETLRARKNVEHIVNRYRLGERAEVELEFRSNGRTARIRRVGDYRGSTLEFQGGRSDTVFGAEAEQRLEEALVANEPTTLELALTTRGLLQQDVIRSVLEAKPAERYRHISSVLGLGELEDFEDAVREASGEASRAVDSATAELEKVAASTRGARYRLEEARDRQRRLPSIDAALRTFRELTSETPDGLKVDRPAALTAEAVGRMAQQASRLSERIRHHLFQLEAVRSGLESLGDEPSDQAIGELRSRISAAADSAQRHQAKAGLASAQLAAAETQSEDLARLAAAAIPLLSERCPVCGQEIESGHVEQELLSRARGSSTLVSLREARDAGTAAASDALALHQVASQELESALALRESWARIRARQDALAAEEAQLLEDSSAVRLEAAARGRFDSVGPAIVIYLSQLREQLVGLSEILDQGTVAGEIDRAKAELASFEEAVVVREQRLDAVKRRASVLNSLAANTVKARVAVTEQRFKAIQPLVADIYSRLDPHPAFKTIEFELDTYYRRGTTSPVVRDLLEDVSADPLMVFSASQANIAALSYFLAMGWTASGKSLPFVLLDDPLQSMDDINVLGFADLCRHLRSQRQLLISTHERRFASLLRRKLAPRASNGTTVFLEFIGWDRTGPSVRRKTVEPEMLDRPLRLLREGA